MVIYYKESWNEAGTKDLKIIGNEGSMTACKVVDYKKALTQFVKLALEHQINIRNFNFLTLADHEALINVATTRLCNEAQYIDYYKDLHCINGDDINNRAAKKAMMYNIISKIVYYTPYGVIHQVINKCIAHKEEQEKWGLKPWTQSN